MPTDQQRTPDSVDASTASSDDASVELARNHVHHHHGVTVNVVRKPLPEPRICAKLRAISVATQIARAASGHIMQMRGCVRCYGLRLPAGREHEQ
jgi:hypothetical protein